MFLLQQIHSNLGNAKGYLIFQHFKGCFVDTLGLYYNTYYGRNLRIFVIS
jgi:hypothetical protein